jgi:SAM-dependent methyltransferase
MAEIYSESFWRLFNELDISLDPAGPEQLYEIADPYLAAGQRILDVGCRDARHLIELCRRCRGTGVGVDPVPWHVERARAAVADAGLSDRVTIRPGVAEDLAEESASFDIVWCRDVVEVLPDLATALTHLRRVLRPDGHMIVFTNVLHGPVDAGETAAIHQPLGNVVDNLVEPRLEGAFAAAGFVIMIKHLIGTEWREYLEEREHVVSGQLLRLARLRRSRRAVVDRYGPDAYRTAEASLQWGVHQFLGRFVPVIYVLSGTS